MFWCLLDGLYKINYMVFYVRMVHIKVKVKDNYSCKYWDNWADIWNDVSRKHVVIEIKVTTPDYTYRLMIKYTCKNFLLV